MLAALALLLLTSAIQGEWVEISQHQRRQPPPYKNPFDDSTPPNNKYTNYTVTEEPWHRGGFTRVPNFGSVKRVQLQSKDKDMFSIGAPSKINEDRRYDSFGPVRAPNINIKETLEVPNVNMESTVEHRLKDKLGKNNYKSKINNPFLEFNIDTEKSYEYFNDHNQFQENKERNQFHEIRLTHNRDHAPNKQRKTYTERTQGGFKNGAEQVKKNNENTGQYLNLPEGNDFNRREIITNINKTLRTVTKTSFINTPQVPNSSNPVTKHFNKHILDNNTDEPIKKENITVSNITQNRVENKIYHHAQNFEHDEIQHVNVSDDNTKTNPVEVIWKLMKVVTDNISRNTRRSFRSKVRYLERLRNNIIMNIEERIEQAWPDDSAEAAGARRKREARGHVEFPSSESALMTISFLTFAVFLIKLVLQVIHTYKNKTMMVTPTLVAAVGRAAAALRS